MTGARRGFTLVELMISIVLFSIAIAGVLSVATSIAQGFREQRAAVATESQVRMPMDFLTDAIRQAGPAVPTATNACGPTSGIQAADIASATCECGAIIVSCGGVANTSCTTAPDTLDLVYASGAVVTATTQIYGAGAGSVQVVDASQFSPGDMILISDLNQGITVGVTGVNVGTGTLTLAAQQCASINWPTASGYPAFSTVVRVQRARFAVQVSAGGLGDGINDGVPMLMMQPGGPNGGQAFQPLAEGIEDMQVALAVDVNGNGAIDPGEWAFDTAADGPLVGPILAAKLVLTGRAVTIVSGGGQTPFVQPAALDHTATLNGPDVFRRRTLEATIELRNVGGSP